MTPVDISAPHDSLGTGLIPRATQSTNSLKGATQVYFLGGILPLQTLIRGFLRIAPIQKEWVCSRKLNTQRFRFRTGLERNLTSSHSDMRSDDGQGRERDQQAIEYKAPAVAIYKDLFQTP